MNPLPRPLFISFALVAAFAADAAASTIAQNVSWTIDRPGTTTKYRIVAYGDSIFAGYKGSISEVAIYSAPTVDGEYTSYEWDADIETIRRTKSGAKAGDVYRNKIVDDRAYMQDPSTRIVTFEMCGNDALRARDDFSGQDGTCDYSRLDGALDKCTLFVERAMVFINANAHQNVVRKIVSNLYYPGYDADDVETDCRDECTGQPVNKQDVFLPMLLRMNWRICNFASQYGFACTDSFADFMGADYDSNDDNRKDSKALRWREGESEEAYVQRISVTLRPTVRDANMHFTSSKRSFDYIQSDDTHPTYQGGEVELGFFGGSGEGDSEPRFSDTKLDRRRGKNPIWKKFGHERMGLGLAVFTPAAP
jgi:lysophospholipase L1-like esterase